MDIPIRAVSILLKGDHILLMERKKEGKGYFVFPGGGVEVDETLEEAVLREMMEETSLEVQIEKLLYTHFYDSPLKGKSSQYFFLCSTLSDEYPKLADSNERSDMEAGKGFYKPQWIALSTLPSLLLYPLEIRDWLLEDIQNNFIDTPKEATISIESLRQW